MRKAVRESKKSELDKAQSLAMSHYRTGSLTTSLKVKVVTKKGWIIGMVGPQTSSQFTIAYGTNTKGKNKGGVKLAQPSKYLHFLEGGTKHATAKPVLGKAPVDLDKIISAIANGISDELG